MGCHYKIELTSDNGDPIEVSAENTAELGLTENDIVLIKGEKGDKGDPGENGADGQPGKQGADGLSAYQIAFDNGFTGTEAEWLASLKGEAGPQGPKGDTGSTGATGPKGDKGDKGETGMTGPQGPQGIQGEKGDSYTLTDEDMQTIADKVEIPDNIMTYSFTADKATASDGTEQTVTVTKVNGHAVEADVPANAKFTDTVPHIEITGVYEDDTDAVSGGAVYRFIINGGIGHDANSVKRTVMDSSLSEIGISTPVDYSNAKMLMANAGQFYKDDQNCVNVLAMAEIINALCQQIDSNANGISAKQDALTFDSEPTADSTNPVTSGGIKAYVDANAGSGSKEWTSLASDSLTEETTFKKYAIDDTGLEEIFFRMVMPKTPDSTTTYPILRAGLNANAWYNVNKWQIASSKSLAKNTAYPTVIESFLEKINGLWRLKASHYTVNTDTGTYSFCGLQQEPQSKISSISIDNNGNSISIPVGTTVEIYGR